MPEYVYDSIVVSFDDQRDGYRLKREQRTNESNEQKRKASNGGDRGLEIYYSEVC